VRAAYRPVPDGRRRDVDSAVVVSDTADDVATDHTAAVGTPYAIERHRVDLVIALKQLRDPPGSVRRRIDRKRPIGPVHPVVHVLDPDAECWLDIERPADAEVTTGIEVVLEVCRRQGP